jgi:DNA-3-methyladenine glycosylase II
MSKKITIATSTKLHLEKDPVMKILIERYTAPAFIRNDNLFLDVIETIINQQLSSKAADTIFRRFKDLFTGREISPHEVLHISEETFRGSGISYAKIRYIKGFAEIVEKKEINLEKLHELSDEAVIEELIKINGIGKWSAEMMLMFSFGRPDVFSTGDLGLCTAVSRLYHVERKDIKAIEKISQKWSPYRTTASWYLWRSLEASKE